MPLVRIDAPEALPVERLLALADAVHDALVATVDVPVDDRFQVLARHPRALLRIDPTFLGVARGPEATVIHVTLRAGRSDAKKRALYAGIVDRASERAGIRREDLMIVLSENGLPDWSFGNGLAQYAPG